MTRGNRRGDQRDGAPAAQLEVDRPFQILGG